MNSKWMTSYEVATYLDCTKNVVLPLVSRGLLVKRKWQCRIVERKFKSELSDIKKHKEPLADFGELLRRILFTKLQTYTRKKAIIRESILMLH